MNRQELEALLQSLAPGEGFRLEHGANVDAVRTLLSRIARYSDARYSTKWNKALKQLEIKRIL